jgi:hypothetical protein
MLLFLWVVWVLFLVLGFWWLFVFGVVGCLVFFKKERYDYIVISLMWCEKEKFSDSTAKPQQPESPNEQTNQMTTQKPEPSTKKGCYRIRIMTQLEVLPANSPTSRASSEVIIA